MKFNFIRFAPKMFLILALIVVQACNKDADPFPPQGSAGYFVVNEGGFGKSNTSISFYDRTTGKMTNDIFAAANGRPLGDQTQSMTVFKERAYVVVQNSSKVEVINPDDFKSIKTITEGIESPRFFLGITVSKGYISDWGADGVSGSVKVVELGNFTVTKTIPVGHGTNKMVLKDDKVYVTNNGGYDTDRNVSVIDTSSEKVVATIEVGDNPSNLVFDKDGNLWVGGIGNYVDTKPWIAKIKPDNTVAFRIDLPEMTYLGPSVAVNNAGDKVYFTHNGNVYAMAITESALPAKALIEKDFYGLAVDPITDEIIGTEAIDFSTSGKIYVYSPAGELKNSEVVGIAPNGVAFK